MEKIAYIIKDITAFGKLMAVCIENDIHVWRTYWNERETDTVYSINQEEKRCYYSNRKYYENNGYKIEEPKFKLNEYGIYHIKND